MTSEKIDSKTLEGDFHLDLKGCARCGADGHANLLFRKFKGNPVEHGDGQVDTHWAMCPVLGEPIILFTQERGS